MSKPLDRNVRGAPIEIRISDHHQSHAAESVRDGLIKVLNNAPGVVQPATVKRFESAAHKLSSGKPLRVVILHDAGFLGGAGVAAGRQALSIMSRGHQVGMVCSFRNAPPRLRTRGRDLSANWLGITKLPDYNGWFGRIRDHQQTVDAVSKAVESYSPDLVIVGNLHGGKWPLEIVERIHQNGCPTVLYTHDCHHFTGGCVYPMECSMYTTGCNSTCPKANEYPEIESDKIQDAHLYRRNLLSGSDPIPVAGNSQWVCELTRDSLGPGACLGMLPLPIDTEMFSPVDRGVARRLLGIPGQATVGIFGAVDMGNDQRKGLAFLPEVCERLSSSGKCHLISFGKNSETLKNVQGLGMITDHRLMPLLYSAADIQMSFSTWETFGQTALEAASCARPVVVRDSGGIVQIARDGVNGIVVRPDTPDAFVEAALKLAEDPGLRAEMGAKGRELAIANHSMNASCRSLEQWVSALGTRVVGAASFGIEYESNGVGDSANTHSREGSVI